MIVEPFAGAAAYSLLHWQHNIILVEKYHVLVNIWKWLQKVTPETILALPDVPKGTLIPEDVIPDEAKNLIGFCINNGSAQPKLKASPKGNFCSWERDKPRIAKDIEKIHDWVILCSDYRGAPDIEATWFIDPPYQKQGQYYKHNKIDYAELAEWCKTRKGQVIVCEGEGADWLPFRPFQETSGQKRKSKEVIWTND